MQDFTLKTYNNLLQELLASGYSFQTFQDFIQQPEYKAVILRHDVDERPENALKMAQIEYELGIKATYYFRIHRISNNPVVISEVVKMGHEIGYHYEDYAAANGDIKQAIDAFSKNLDYFRTYYPVQTVCMHGSSMSDYDNRTMWQYYNLADFGIAGEPYMSVDYSKVLYMTDTGRRWDGAKYSVRDTVASNYGFSFRRTSDIIEAALENKLPDQVILQSHTLWTDVLIEWLWLEYREIIRNKIKMVIVKVPVLKRVAYRLIKLHSK